METALDAIKVEKDPNWTNRLDAAEKIVIDDPHIRKVKKMCITAYREYAKAIKEMDGAKSQLEILEKAVAAGTVDGLAEKHAGATDAISQTNAHLELSQMLIRKCTAERRHLKGRLKLVRN